MPRQRGSSTDPSTVSGKGEKSLGGGAAVADLRAIQEIIDSLEFSEPNADGPANRQDVWDAMAGDGTPNDPKLITNDHELQSMSIDATASYRVANNIDASLTSGWDDGLGWDPIVDFIGTFDGDGYVIKGLSATREEKDVGMMESIIEDNLEEVIFENSILYDFSMVGVDGRISAGTLAGELATAVAPRGPEQIIRDVLVIDSEVVGASAGGLAGSPTLQSRTERCGVLGCTIRHGESTNQDNLGGIYGQVSNFDWGGDDTEQYNYQIFNDLYALDNEIGESEGETGALFGDLYGSLRLDTNEEFSVDINNCVIYSSSGNEWVIGKISVDASEIVDTVNIDPLYIESGLDPLGEIDEYSDPIDEVIENYIVLKTDAMRGSNPIETMDGLDYNTVWATLESADGEDTPFDGFPMLAGLDADLQVAGQRFDAESLVGGIVSVLTGYEGGVESSAAGSGSRAGGDNSLAVGVRSNAGANNSIAVGNRTSVDTIGGGRIGVDQLVFGATQGTFADEALNNGEATLEIDEADGAVVLKIKDSTGTVNTATVAYDA